MATLVDCTTFIPAADCRPFLVQYTLLAATDLPSRPVDLAPFCAKVNSMILLLDPAFIDLKNLLMFTARHVGVFGPLLLGVVS